MPCLFAAFGICHRSHSPLCYLFQIPKPTKIQVKIAQLILSPLLKARHKRHNSKKRHETIVTTSHPDAGNGQRN